MCAILNGLLWQEGKKLSAWITFESFWVLAISPGNFYCLHKPNFSFLVPEFLEPGGHPGYPSSLDLEPPLGSLISQYSMGLWSMCLPCSSVWLILILCLAHKFTYDSDLAPEGSLATPVPQRVTHQLWLCPSSSLARTVSGHHCCIPVKILKIAIDHVTDLALKSIGCCHIESNSCRSWCASQISKSCLSVEIIPWLWQLVLKFNMPVWMKPWCARKLFDLHRHDQKEMEE